MPQRDFDAIIVGGRIAGCMEAGCLSRAGFHTLIIEQATLPRDTVSAPVMYGDALRMLDGIGAGAVIDGLGLPKIRRVRKIWADRAISGYLLPVGGRDYGYGTPRALIDKALLDHVRTLPGVTVREGFTARRILWEDGRTVGIEGYAAGGSDQPERFFADIVVGADGIRSFTAREVGARVYRSDPPNQFHYYAFFEDFDSLDEPELTVNQSSPHQTIITFEVGQNLMAVSWMPAARLYDNIRGRHDEAYTAAWQSIPELRERGRRARRVTKLMGRLPTNTFFRQPWGPGWALVGDAAYYTDPNGGRGFYDALRGAELLAHAFAQYRRGRPWDEAMRVFQTVRDFEYEPSYRYVRAMADRDAPRTAEMERLLDAAESNPAIIELLLSIHHGVDVARFAGAPRLPLAMEYPPITPLPVGVSERDSG